LEEARDRSGSSMGVRGVSKIQHKRPEFQHENVVNDPITGEEIKVYSPVKRLARQLLQVPFAIAAATVLAVLIAGCFAIEIFISEVYDGPFKRISGKSSQWSFEVLTNICRLSSQPSFSLL